MKIVKRCPTCNKVAEVKGELKLGSLRIVTYQCNHTVTETGIQAVQDDTLNILSLDGKRPFPFQLDGARFIEESNGRVLVADEMGLGKTVQALQFVIAHPEARPFVAFVKSGLRVQWGKESVRWGDLLVQVVQEGSNPYFLPNFDGYIISLDSAWRIGLKANRVKSNGTFKGSVTYEPIPGKSLPEQLKALNIKTVILDECQTIKNPESKRTKAIQNVCREMKHVIALSGTPIKNNAAEYFPVLNILRPDKFPNRSNFVYGWCDTYFDGYKAKTGGLKNPERFKQFTHDFIIRRERKDVLPDLPSVFRKFQFCELGEMVEEMYQKTVKEFQEYYSDSGAASALERSANILAFLSKMRHLTGLAKIDPVCGQVEEFVMSTDRKLAIFVHHKDVGETLKLKLGQIAKEWPAEYGESILQITSDMDSYERDEVVSRWSGPKHRICILSTLASGEGLNLQFCSDCIMCERQWNPANEEQAEARFPRPGSTADKINATYHVAVGTVDEFFSELVERKREIVASTLSGGEAPRWDETGLVRELAPILMEKGGKKWGW